MQRLQSEKRNSSHCPVAATMTRPSGLMCSGVPFFILVIFVKGCSDQWIDTHVGMISKLRDEKTYKTLSDSSRSEKVVWAVFNAFQHQLENCITLVICMQMWNRKTSVTDETHMSDHSQNERIRLQFCSFIVPRILFTPNYIPSEYHTFRCLYQPSTIVWNVTVSWALQRFMRSWHHFPQIKRNHFKSHTTDRNTHSYYANCPGIHQPGSVTPVEPTQRPRLMKAWRQQDNV